MATKPRADLQRRIDELATKANDGQLSETERAEYDTYIEAMDVISLLRKRKALQQRIQESRRQLDAEEFTDYSEGALDKRFLELKQRAKNAKT